MATLWDVTGSEVVSALAAERRSAGGVSSGLALTLIVVVDERKVAAAEAAATVAASAHPCRLLLVVRHHLDSATPRLDAEISVGGRLGPGEAVVMRMQGRLSLHAESVVLPLLGPDAPVVTWWVDEMPELIANDPLGVLADRRVTDCSVAADPMAAVAQRARDYYPGDTDLAWTRTTGWRSLLASAFDGAPGAVSGGSVLAEAGNPSAPLLAGWLSRRLATEIKLEESSGPGVTQVSLQTAAGPMALTRDDGRTARLSRTGHPDRQLPLARRDLGDLMAEELHRLDADEPYAEALAAASGTDHLEVPTGARSHIWRDPASQAQAEGGTE